MTNAAARLSAVGGPPDFVDRRPERAALDAWAVEAWAGTVRIVIVRGEPGIGKTALVDQAVRGWRETASQILAATCHEDLGVPYLPVLTALHDLRRSVATGDADPLRADDRTPEPFVRLTDDLVTAARARRVVLRIDDIQWADPATCDLLAHMLTAATSVAAVEPLTLLVVLTTRPVEHDAPAARLLARLRRESAVRMLPLGALDELAVNDLLGCILGRTPPRRLLDEVYELTEGNPLFVRTLVEHLVESGTIDARGRVIGATTLIGEHTDVDEVLRSRVDRLDEATKRTMILAATMGNGRSIDELAHVAAVDDDELDRQLEVAEQAGVLVEREDGTYWFPHPVVRHVLSRWPTQRARRRHHLTIATRLAELPRLAGGDADGDLELRIAHHLLRAGRDAPAEQLAHYAQRAVERSIRMGAWAKAARYADAALRALDSGDVPVPVDAARADLHLAAALAHFRNHDPETTRGQCERAIEIARQFDDLDRWGRALLLEHRSRLTLTDEPIADSAIDELRNFIAHAGQRVPELRARCWQLCAEIAVTHGDLVGGADAALQALTLAEHVADDQLLAEVCFAQGLERFGALDLDAASERFEASSVAARLSRDEWVEALPAGRMALLHVLRGDLDAATRVASQTRELAQRTHHWAEAGMADAVTTVVSAARGDVAATERAAADADQIHARSAYRFIVTMSWPALAYARALRLDRLGAHDVITTWQRHRIGGSARMGLLVDALTLPVDQLRDQVQLDRYTPASVRPLHAFSLGGVVIDVELGARLDRPDLLSEALVRLDEIHRRGVRLLLPLGTSVGRLRAMAMIGLGRIDDGLAELARTRAWLDQIGAVPESLRCAVERCIALAELAEHAPQAEPGFEEQVRALADVLDRSSQLASLQRLRERLPGRLGTGTRLRRTVVAWDMVGSTPLLVRAGDEGFLDVLHEVNDLIRARLADHGGVEFKHTGDGIHAWFVDADAALRCSLAIRSDLRSRNARDARATVQLRTGIAIGRPIEDAGDLFGVTVVVACRLCDVADAEQVLCSADVIEAAGPAVPSRSIGAHRLKGLDDDIEVVELVT